MDDNCSNCINCIDWWASIENFTKKNKIQVILNVKCQNKNRNEFIIKEEICNQYQKNR